MKVVKILGIILALLGIVYLVACAMGEKEIEVKRSTTINATAADVFPHIASLQAQEKWSPWAENDPSNVTTFEGEPGTVGSRSSWKGDSTGIGSQEIMEIIPNERVVNHLVFTEPMESESDAIVALTETDGKTEVSWSLNTTLPFLARAFSSAAKTGMEAGVGAPFEKGLNTLKKMCETTYEGYRVKTTNAPAQTYIGKREVVSVDKLGAYFAKHFPAIGGALGKAGVAPTGMPVSLAYSWDEEKRESEILAAMPVPAGTTLEGYETVTIPAQKTGTIDFYGPYEKSEVAHFAMDKYMKANSIQPQWPAIEQYVTDPGQEPNPDKWLTKVTYLFGN